MSEKRFELQHINDLTDQEYMRLKKITDNGELITLGEVVDLLNELNDETVFLAKQKDYWKNKAMTLLMQVRRLTPRMSAKEVIEFGKELEDE